MQRLFLHLTKEGRLRYVEVCWFQENSYLQMTDVFPCNMASLTVTHLSECLWGTGY